MKFREFNAAPRPAACPSERARNRAALSLSRPACGREPSVSCIFSVTVFKLPPFSVMSSPKGLFLSFQGVFPQRGGRQAGKAACAEAFRAPLRRPLSGAVPLRFRQIHAVHQRIPAPAAHAASRLSSKSPFFWHWAIYFPSWSNGIAWTSISSPESRCCVTF